jgi:hypothetical protein
MTARNPKLESQWAVIDRPYNRSKQIRLTGLDDNL